MKKKVRDRIREKISAIGKAHHTFATTPVRERRYAADHKEAANSIEVLPAPAERRKEKPVKSGGGGLAALFVIIALVYTFWPIDLMPGLLLDDLVCWFICMAAMKSAGRKQYEEM